jgi:hypothetical protein
MILKKMTKMGEMKMHSHSYIVYVIVSDVARSKVLDRVHPLILFKPFIRKPLEVRFNQAVTIPGTFAFTGCWSTCKTLYGGSESNDQMGEREDYS